MRLSEGGMPSGVIRHKQRIEAMTDKEFAEKHSEKTDDELRSMAWRLGYGKGAGKGSDHLVNRRKRGLGEETILELSKGKLKAVMQAADERSLDHPKARKHLASFDLAHRKVNGGAKVSAGKDGDRLEEGWYGDPGNHDATFNHEHLTHAKRIIGRAEKDLGKLSDGQRRDLLADNTNHSLVRIAAMVKHIGSLKEDLAGMDPVDRIYAKSEVAKGTATWHDSNSLKKRKVSGVGNGDDVHARLLKHVANQNARPRPKLTLVKNEETAKEVEVIEGKTWKDADYSARTKDRLKAKVAARKARRAEKGSIEEDVFPEVRTLNKKKRPDKKASTIESRGTGI